MAASIAAVMLKLKVPVRVAVKTVLIADESAEVRIPLRIPVKVALIATITAGLIVSVMVAFIATPRVAPRIGTLPM